MRITSCLSAAFLILISGIIPGCGDIPQEKLLADSIARADSIATHYCLENVLGIGSEMGLGDEYPEGKVVYDTIWGAEGFFSMGTILRTDSVSHIEITWTNEAMKTNVVSATLVSDSDWYGDTLARGKWKSCKGVYLGMSVEELEKINGRPFTFKGFGWDYAGTVTDWQGGNLQDKGIAVQLSEGPFSGKLTDEQSAQLLGNVPVQSDNPMVKEFNPRVWSISVAK